ncbi:MAG: hypothetical protein ACYS99_14775, partial [Planctomycetota bacterium]|jgi:hypothetical protein
VQAKEEVGEHERLARRIVEELDELGLEIDLAGLAIEVRDPEDCTKDLDRQQDLFYPESYFEGMRLLRLSVGLDGGSSVEDFREKVVGGISESLVAYYQPDRKALVFVRSFLGRLAEVSGLDALVAHELVHAWQDRENGLRRLVESRPRTTEEVMITRTLIEGHAEIVALALLLRRNDRDLTALDLENLDTGIERLLAGEYASLPYTVGRKLMLPMTRGRDSEALRTCLSARPASTEQAIHPGKLGRDAPVEVSLPDWPDEAGPAELVHEDVLGEMFVYSLLLELGVERGMAWVGATGWDGDRLHVYRIGEAGRAILWRTVWDREDDAEQFADVVAHVEGTVARRGRVVDYAHATSATVSAALARALERKAFDGEPSETDAASTAAAEAVWLAEQGKRARIEGERWVHEEFGFTIPVPAGFEQMELRGMQLLMGTVADGFGDNITALQLPNQGDVDLEKHIAENRAMLEKMGLTVDSIGEAEVGGRPVMMVEYHGRMAPKGPVLHFLALAHITEKTQLIVTATILEKRWEEVGPVVRKCLEAVELAE